MQKTIIANWKMNPPTAKEAKELFDEVKKGVKSIHGVQVIICPPFLYLPLLKGLPLGAQNVSYEEKGAFTGEVSPLMVKNLGIQYVILGHSESRKHLGDTDETINKKIKEALHIGLTPIFCIGEKEGEDKAAVLEQQITIGLKDVAAQGAQKIIIAYEPVWAIGTGKNCSVGKTTEAIAAIKKILSGLYGQSVAGVTILYGGSVNAQNASAYLKETEVNGLLVGGASLKGEEFVSIVKSVS